MIMDVDDAIYDANTMAESTRAIRRLRNGKPLCGTTKSQPVDARGRKVDRHVRIFDLKSQ